MFNELDKYTYADHFFYKINDNLSQVCNAPIDKSGVYVIYALKDGKIELVYIGHAGEIKSDGSFLIGKSDLGGLKDRLVNGSQFGSPRHKSWNQQMSAEGIIALDVYWYVTHNEDYIDNPLAVENKLLSIYREIYGELPRWNSKD
ncbi:hypothetical protein LX64_00463 [Chitinophaga skermanii]|uniref:GIY-YIG domain-containing protein n=1 Tax=Chitinophaga skermanii TaxID=331697 RepID=A0A327R229_9BACT|nr:hypothetical protein [Chitinophaga skermanii]RAJ10856.1 hypothetical protein LX64_00463 [Chitinophaga skermanii]